MIQDSTDRDNSKVFSKNSILESLSMVSGNGQSPITFTLWAKRGQGIITKRVSKDTNGQVVKDSSLCWMSEGVGRVVNIDFSEYPSFLNGLKKYHAISHGVPKNKNLPIEFPVVSDKKFKANGTDSAITRSLQHIEYPTDSNFLVMVDYDPPTGSAGLSVDTLVAEINKVLPGFEDAAKVVTHSTSSCISDENGNEVTPPSAGYHLYFMLPPGADVPRFREIFKVRAWTNGHGYILISGSGAMLTRNHLFDEFVMSPERLDFVPGAKIPDGWTQNRPEPVYLSGNVFDPATLPDLTDNEREQYKAMVEDAKSAIKGEAEVVQAEYITDRAKAMQQDEPSIPLDRYRAIVQAACSKKDLYDDFIIYLDSMPPATVRDIVANPDLYHGVTCADPLEPFNNTAGKAKIYTNQGKGDEKPIIKSFFHGDNIFFLHSENVVNAEETVEGALQWISDTDNNRTIINGWLNRINGLNTVDTDIIKSAVQKKTGVKISNLNKDLKDKKKKEKKEKAKARQKKISAKRAKIGIKEILYNSTKTGQCCKEVSKALRNYPEQKILRFAGSIVMIVDKPPTTVKMVQKIHERGGEYPSMPTIVELTIETLCHEVEKVAVCQVAKEDGTVVDIPWPKNILAGVKALSEYHEKPLVGILEHPYVNDQFDPILDQGYDDATGLYRVFNVVPDLECFKDATDALNYLVDEVLQDFIFSSELDRMAAISALLTGMQRKLINNGSGCPGFIFTAPIQSSGKTELCQLINHSLYGRPAAASSYSGDDTEMSKMLLGILLEGHSCILFDNLQEGSVIESNELAKVITADSYSNRWLGQNKTITVPSSVLWLMTGNNVSVCGDFNTRFLVIELNTNKANPDQRRYKRANIADWCEKNRGKILGACMKIIIDGKDYHNPKIKPSRFPSWDKFVRFPIEKVSGTDVAEIFQNNKMADPKIEGQRIFFEAWFNAFGSSSVTVKQVLDKCRYVPQGVNLLDYDNEMSIATKDIFSGGALPSTRSLGKWLAGMKNRFFGDYKLICVGLGTSREQKNKTVWIVDKQSCK